MHVIFCDKCGKSVEGDRAPVYTVKFATDNSKILRNRKHSFDFCRDCAEKVMTELEASIQENEDIRINGCKCE